MHDDQSVSQIAFKFRVAEPLKFIRFTYLLQVSIMSSQKSTVTVIRKSELHFSRDRTVINWGYHTVRTGNPYTSLQRMVEIIAMSGYKFSEN
jgi:hypothetical protein